MDINPSLLVCLSCLFFVVLHVWRERSKNDDDDDSRFSASIRHRLTAKMGSAFQSERQTGDATTGSTGVAQRAVVQRALGAAESNLKRRGQLDRTTSTILGYTAVSARKYRLMVESAAPRGTRSANTQCQSDQTGSCTNGTATWHAFRKTTGLRWH